MTGLVPKNNNKKQTKTPTNTSHVLFLGCIDVGVYHNSSLSNPSFSRGCDMFYPVCNIVHSTDERDVAPW